jgi:glycerol-1-phosphate dehydrogenase [NAD(P)+]
LLLTGPTHSLHIAQSTDFDYVEAHEVVSSNAFSEVKRLAQVVYEHSYDLIIALGGGTVLDVAKRISLKQRINHLAVPTIISNDGLISPISVLTNSQGATESIPGQMPMGVIVDMEIISASPMQYIKAAAGDILSNMSATNDWVYASEHNGEEINDISFQLSRTAAYALTHFDPIDLKAEEFLKMIIQGQVNSGIAMGLAGTSRPCSGSEHLLSHAIDYLGLSADTLHGFQVGSLSLFSLYLQGKLKQKHIAYGEKVGLSFDLFNHQSITGELLGEVIEKSRGMRPGRITILDDYTNDEIIDKYKEFTEYIFELEGRR